MKILLSLKNKINATKTPSNSFISKWILFGLEMMNSVRYYLPWIHSSNLKPKQNFSSFYFVTKQPSITLDLIRSDNFLYLDVSEHISANVFV